jgi:RNA polymerase sigma-70 factor (sigma-E family)
VGPAEEEDFRAFVTARWQALVRTAFLLVGDHGYAEDLVQTALARTHRNWRRIERKDSPEVYVRRVLVNLANSFWHRRLRMREVVQAETPDSVADDPTVAHDQRDELWNALRSLSPRTRAVLVLRYFEDLPEAQIAIVLGCSVGTVKSTASRGIAKLRQSYVPAMSELNGGVSA